MPFLACSGVRMMPGAMVLTRMLSAPNSAASWPARAWIAPLLAMAALALFLAYWMVHGMIETRSDGALSRVLGWTEWPFYIPGIVSLVLWATVAASQLLESDDDG